MNPYCGRTSITAPSYPLPVVPRKRKRPADIPWTRNPKAKSSDSPELLVDRLKSDNAMPDTPGEKEWHEDAVLALDEVASETEFPDWDGDGAEAISAATVQRAKEFVGYLPPSIAPPEVCADTNGWMTFTWHPRKGAILMASVKAGRDIAMATRLDGAAIKGDVPFSEMIDRKLVPQINDLYTPS